MEIAEVIYYNYGEFSATIEIITEKYQTLLELQKQIVHHLTLEHRAYL